MDDAVVRQVIGRCQELTPAECEEFLSNGFVVIRSAFDRRIAEEVVEQAWRSLEQDANILRDDRESWKKMPYVRPAGSKRSIRLAEEAPRALRAQTDLLGGGERLKGGGNLAWGDGTVANLCKDGDRPYPEPRPEMDGWHFDGWDFYHYLDSPEQALLVVPLFSEIKPHSGGTLIATDSIGVVAKFLAAHPEGVHPDGTQGGGYLIPSLIEQCTQFVEVTGDAGDLVLLHPYMLHRAAANPSGVARFIQNGRLSLAEPMDFNRPNPADYSLVELAVCVRVCVRARARARDACVCGTHCLSASLCVSVHRYSGLSESIACSGSRMVRAKTMTSSQTGGECRLVRFGRTRSARSKRPSSP